MVSNKWPPRRSNARGPDPETGDFEMTITIQSEGRRHYLIGDTYPIRAAARTAGCKWDPDRRAWWSGKRETAERLVSGVAAGSVRSECGWRKVGEAFLVAVPDGLTATTGDRVTVRSSGGGAKQIVLGEQRGPGLYAPVREQRERAPRQSLSLVGERSELTSQYEASKHNRAPHREIGEVVWLGSGSGAARRQLAVVVIGYDPARYVSSELAEDMGHYDMRSGYYGTLYYRAATREQYEELQARAPREAGYCEVVS